MKKSLVLTISTVILLCIASYGQERTSNEHNDSESAHTLQQQKTLEDRVSGTFEVIRINNNKRVYILSKEILIDIEKKRDENKEVFYELNNDIKIRILPRSVINAAGFVPVKN